MATYTEAGNYATYQADGGKWYYHPTAHDWFAFNANDSFSRPYESEAAAIEAAELQESMDAEGVDGPIIGSDGVIYP